VIGGGKWGVGLRLIAYRLCLYTECGTAHVLQTNLTTLKSMNDWITMAMGLGRTFRRVVQCGLGWAAIRVLFLLGFSGRARVFGG